MDNEQCGEWCNLVLKGSVAGSVKKVQCTVFPRRADSGWSEVSHFP